MGFFRIRGQSSDSRVRDAIQQRGNLPKHIAIIMDGNGRWARRHGRHRVYGHAIGIESVRDVTEACAELGIGYLTLYTFSTENWYRPESEVSAIMDLLVKTVRSERKTLLDNNVQLKVIGEMARLPELCRLELQACIDATAHCTGLTLSLAISYSGRWELTEATRRIAEKVRLGSMDPDEVDEHVIEEHLETAGMPDPDLLIRTGGDLRVSNFLLWQVAYSEIFVTESSWPEFRRRHLYRILKQFQDRERRFGRLKMSGETVNA
ncbi:MAG TPA: isoprenyl transferase [Rhodothermales bacterium]|nr:isoprenyl transferase [Rhodothermales bacterium]